MKLTRYYVSNDGLLVSVDAHIPRDRTRAVYLASDVDQELRPEALAPPDDKDPLTDDDRIRLAEIQELIDAATADTPPAEWDGDVLAAYTLLAIIAKLRVAPPPRADAREAPRTEQVNEETTDTRVDSQ